MAKLSYTATWGSYHEDYADNATVANWIRSSIQANPLEGGMRALTFYQGRRGVIAFRGTDLNVSGISGQADRCVAEVLEGQATLDDFCGQFSIRTLDYVARALEFADATATAHPDVEWLYTGHSLGALLAQVVAAVRGTGTLALGFSAPPVAPVIRNHTSLDPTTLPAWQALTLYNEWDPLRYEAKGQLPGASCVWTVQPEPAGCQECDTFEPGPNMSSPTCRECFLNTHVFALYLGLVRSRRRPESCGQEAGGEGGQGAAALFL
ncbi:unnamed protein product [Polarella glacialis]|uniref:Fungal lipase-like domain-containing protein n=1 Tax=Polarella glacialis TaxID=89957 RepID=A0A813GTY3_POLGL|nr:unnamed protein product [Polarella glacialis]